MVSRPHLGGDTPLVVSQQRLPELYTALRLADELRTSRDLLVVYPELETSLAIQPGGGLYSFGVNMGHLNAWAFLVWLRTMSVKPICFCRMSQNVLQLCSPLCPKLQLWHGRLHTGEQRGLASI